MNSDKKMAKVEQPESEESARETLDDWFRSSTCHGIPNIYKNRLYLKILWAICLALSMGYCGWLVYNSVTGYLDFTVVTQIASHNGKPS